MTDMTIGDSVPNFEALSTGGETFRLSDYRDQHLVVFFYPKDNTPGCTLESQDFRDYYAQFKALNCAIVGISRDSIRSHEGFKSKQVLPFELIADTEEAVCQLFNVIKLKNLYGKQVRGIERSTFLINRQGLLVKEWRKVKVKGHVAEVLQTLSTPT
ncbi:MAG: peroxiredoxin [Methylococcales bacterium]|nr:peroxiredoxin [Methylococcales bacterium]